MDNCGKQHCLLFVSSNLGIEILFKKRGHQKKCAWKQKIEAPLFTLCYGVSRKFYVNSVSFFNLKALFFFHSLIIVFLWFAQIWLKFEEKKHTKTIFNVQGGELLLTSGQSSPATPSSMGSFQFSVTLMFQVGYYKTLQNSYKN